MRPFSLRKSVIAGLLAIVSAIGVALKDSVVDIFKEGVTPVIGRTICSARELLRKNSAPERLTIVVLRFGNDADDNVSDSLASGISNVYDANVIRSCAQLPLGAGRDPDLVQKARLRYAAIAGKFDADLIIAGEVGVKAEESRILLLRRTDIPSLFIPSFVNEVSAIEFDATHARDYAHNDAFVTTLLETLAGLPEGLRCLPVVFGMCVGPVADDPRYPRSTSPVALNPLRRMFGLEDSLSDVMDEHNTDYSAVEGRIGESEARLTMALYRQYMADELADASQTRQGLLSIAMNSVSEIGNDFIEGAASRDLSRGEVLLEGAISCASSANAFEALQAYRDSLKIYERFPPTRGWEDLHLKAAFARFGILRSIAAIRALSPERGYTEPMTSLVEEQVRQLKEITPSIQTWIEKAYPDAEPELQRRVAVETEVLSAIAENKPDRLKSLLPIGLRPLACKREKITP